MTSRYFRRPEGGEPVEIVAASRPRTYDQAVALARSTGGRVHVLRRPTHPHPKLGRPDRPEHSMAVWIGPCGGVRVSGASGPFVPSNETEESRMDLTVDQAGFARALRLIGRAVPSRPTLPVLQHVLLEGAPGRLTLTATDLDLAIITSTPADVAAPGRVLLRPGCSASTPGNSRPRRCACRSTQRGTASRRAAAASSRPSPPPTPTSSRPCRRPRGARRSSSMAVGCAPRSSGPPTPPPPTRSGRSSRACCSTSGPRG